MPVNLISKELTSSLQNTFSYQGEKMLRILTLKLLSQESSHFRIILQ